MVPAPTPLCDSFQMSGIVTSVAVLGVDIGGTNSARFQIPCRLENDANAAGLAEALFGAGCGSSNVLYVTIGTGIGTGHWKNGAAAEAGHVSIDYRSETRCNCGVRGCIGTGVLAGDELSTRVLDEVSERLRRMTPDRTINQHDAETPIVAAELSRDMGIVGAAAVVLQNS